MCARQITLAAALVFVEAALPQAALAAAAVVTDALARWHATRELRFDQTTSDFWKNRRRLRAASKGVDVLGQDDDRVDNEGVGATVSGKVSRKSTAVGKRRLSQRSAKLTGTGADETAHEVVLFLEVRWIWQPGLHSFQKNAARGYRAARLTSVEKTNQSWALW